MKKSLAITLGLLLCFAFTSPAMAGDLDLFLAEAEAEAEQLNTQNDNTGVLVITPTDPSSEISGSIDGNSGVVGVNQASGVMNNQANAVVTAATVLISAFAEAEVEVEQENSFNVELELLAISKGLIDGSIGRNDGVVGVNQSSGSLNNQANLVAVAAGLGVGPIVALAEGELSQNNSVNGVTDIAVIRMDTISDSISGNSGIVGVNQSAGSLNNQANVLAVSFSE
jgi:hypothetical protein